MAGAGKTLADVPRGAVFRTEDGRFWRKEMTRPDGRCYCHAVATDGGPVAVAGETPVEPLDLPALLTELDELRTLTHDLLIDRDAAALETRERCARAVCEGCREGWPYRAETECHERPDGVAVACDAVPVRALEV